VQMHLADAILRVLVPGGWVSMHELRAQVGKIVDMREHESALEMERVIETRGRHKGGFSVRLTRKAGG
jgi:uncharacterized protein YceH (UPF0502 family)